MEVADGIHRFGTRMVNWYLIERGGRLTLPLKGAVVELDPSQGDQVGVVTLAHVIEEVLPPAPEGATLSTGVRDPQPHHAELPKGPPAPEILTHRPSPAVHRANHELELPVPDRVPRPRRPPAAASVVADVAGHRQQQHPASVIYMSMSLDGYIAGPNDELGRGLGDGGERLHDWGVTPDGEFFRPPGPAV